MKTVPVKYVGPKPRIAVVLPVGARSKGEIVDTVIFERGQLRELSEDDAVQLNNVDPRFEIAGPIKPKKVKLASIQESVAGV